MSPARPRRALPLALLICLAPAGAQAAQSPGPGQVYYERALMSMAGERCGLFTPSVAAALAASVQQSRGAALRAGAEPGALRAVEARARERAAGVACGSADLSLAAERVRAGFAGYARLNTMTFPGDLGSWTAERGTGSESGTGWRLSQSVRAAAGPVLLGLAGDTDTETLTAVAGWPGALAASGARIVVRDPAKAATPYIDRRRDDLAGRTAPRSVSTAFLASARAPAAAGLLPVGAVSGAAFRFPAASVRALEGLDPREAMVLELVYPSRDGERVERIAMEVGDFAAGRAFLTAGR